MENHVHRHAQVGTWVLINASWYNLDGGEGINATLDTLNINASGLLGSLNVIGWETINVNNATLAFTGGGLTTSAVNGQGLMLNNSLVDLNSNAFALTGDVTIDGTSTLQADTPGGTGVFSISGDLINGNIIDMSDGAGAGDTLTVGGNYTASSDLFLDVDFVLDPAAHPGGAILKVPFTYTLSLEDDDILYLQSSGVLAQVYGYSILAEVMREEFPILRDRLGGRRYNGFGSAGGEGAGNNSTGIWARIDGQKRDIEHSGGFDSGEWEQSRGEVEIGLDLPMEVAGGQGVLGFSTHFVQSFAEASSGIVPDADETEIDATGYGAGLSFAWFPGNGFYADVQGRLTVWDTDVEVDANDLEPDVNGLGWGASLEFGKRFAVGTNTSITARSRVVYTDVNFDSFTDDDGVKVKQCRCECKQRPAERQFNRRLGLHLRERS
jgi:outer membrane autotransporter protein